MKHVDRVTVSFGWASAHKVGALPCKPVQILKERTMPTFYVEDHPARLDKVVIEEPAGTFEAKVVTAPEPVAVKTSKAEVK